MLRIIVCAAVLMMSSCLVAQTASDETAIRSILDHILASWGQANAKGMADMYANDADLIVPDGTVLSGRHDIEAFYASAFQRGYAGSLAHADVVRLRKLDATCYVMDGTWSIVGIRQAGASETKEAGVFTGVFVRHHGHWQIAALREQTGATTLHVQP